MRLHNPGADTRTVSVDREDPRPSAATQAADGVQRVLGWLTAAVGTLLRLENGYAPWWVNAAILVALLAAFEPLL